MTISVTVETSSKVSYPKTFPIKVHPGRSKVHDLMEEIERRLNVPVSDQKLYFGKTLLSGAPRKCLPDKLICSPRPAVAVILPEYIHITVEEQNGDSHSLKIDKEKNLKAVMEEIPSCCNLQENVQVIFYFNEKKLCPDEDKSPLQDYGVTHGCTLHVTKHLATDGSIIPHGTAKFNGQEFERGDLSDVPGDREDSPPRPSRLIRFKSSVNFADKQCACREPDPGWRSGGTTLQGHSTQEMQDILRRLSRAGTCKGSKTIARSEIRYAFSGSSLGFKEEEGYKANLVNVVESDPEWRSGGTTLQGQSTQRFIKAEPIRVDPSKKIELVLRLVAREGEEGLKFPEGKCTPLSTLIPPAVQE